MNFSEKFHRAFKDFFDLINKGYPQKSTLKLVCDRHKLSSAERSILFRGVFLPHEIAERRARLITPSEISGRILAVDTLNQLFTIAAYLNGSGVYIATDGLIRDASEIHAGSLPNGIVDRSADLVVKYILQLGVLNTDFFIDKKVNLSEEIAAILRFSVFETNLPHQLIITDKVDQRLKKSKNAILCTSDTQVIEQSENPVFDLARHVLESEFNPIFADLNDLLMKKQ